MSSRLPPPALDVNGLYAFRDNSNGFFPYAGLTIDSAGNIYARRAPVAI